VAGEGQGGMDECDEKMRRDERRRRREVEVEECW
jgi:hypothetical protein